jgi:hypothetical protein
MHDTVRTTELKRARDEAKKEIEAYKTKKEEEFKKFEAEVRHPDFVLFPRQLRSNCGRFVISWTA